MVDKNLVWIPTHALLVREPRVSRKARKGSAKGAKRSSSPLPRADSSKKSKLDLARSARGERTTALRPSRLLCVLCANLLSEDHLPESRARASSVNGHGDRCTLFPAPLLPDGRFRRAGLLGLLAGQHVA